MTTVNQLATPRVQIDLNARTANGKVPARMNLGGLLLKPGHTVVVFEPEDGVAASGVVEEVHDAARLLIIDVDWSTLVDDPALNPHLETALNTLARSGSLRPSRGVVGRYASTGGLTRRIGSNTSRLVAA